MNMKTDWRERYEEMVSKAVDNWYVQATRNPMPMYVCHSPAEYPAWGNIEVSTTIPSPKHVLSAPDRIPFSADKRMVRAIIMRLQLPVIGE
jgi:hypothetical protein